MVRPIRIAYLQFRRQGGTAGGKLLNGGDSESGKYRSSSAGGQFSLDFADVHFHLGPGRIRAG